MRDYLTLGPTPHEEPCAQVGTPGYYERSRIETDVFIDQLIRQFGEPPGMDRFKVKRFPHEFGNYHEVVITYDDELEDSVDFAYNAENNTPGKWDDTALTELRSRGYFLTVVDRDATTERRANLRAS